MSRHSEHGDIAVLRALAFKLGRLPEPGLSIAELFDEIAKGIRAEREASGGTRWLWSDGHVPHGSHAMYGRRGCRCPECIRNESLYQRRWRLRTGEVAVPGYVPSLRLVP